MTVEDFSNSSKLMMKYVNILLEATQTFSVNNDSYDVDVIFNAIFKGTLFFFISNIKILSEKFKNPEGLIRDAEGIVIRNMKEMIKNIKV